MSIKLEDLSTYAKNTWCPGCGNFGIERAAKQAFIELINEDKVKREKIVMVTGIGCHGKIADYINVNSFYSLHGRAIAPAIGMKLANPTLNIVVFVGDGDALGEGLEHTVFAAKKNVDITVIVHDNRVYALTTGQFTPTSPKGFRGGSTPKGSPEGPLNPIELMLVSGATFIARAYSANLNHTKELFKHAILHKGFAFVDVLQPCYTFFDTYKYYGPRVYDLQQDGHNPLDWEAALARAKEWNYGGEEAKRIPIGLFFKADKTTYEDAVLSGKDLYDKSTPRINMVLRSHV